MKGEGVTYMGPTGRHVLGEYFEIYPPQDTISSWAASPGYAAYSGAPQARGSCRGQSLSAGEER